MFKVEMITPFRLRLVAALVLTAGGLWLHELVQAIPSNAVVVDVAIDRAIPFIPWTIWIYFSFFVFIATTVFRVEDAMFWRFVTASTIAALTAWSIVILFPITAPRPDPALMDSKLYSWVFGFVHAADPHHISFPSLHVAVTWICNFLLWQRDGRTRRLVLGVGISLSTLCTKQHIVIDVVGGVTLALCCVWITGRYAHLFPSFPAGNDENSSTQ